MDYQTDFSIAELAARRQRLAGDIEPGAVALIPGADRPLGVERFRQFNDLYYLSGVEVPHAYLLIDHHGRTNLYLSENPYTRFIPKHADWICETTGIDQVLPIGSLTRRLQREKTVYLPSREGEGNKMAWDSLQGWRQGVLNDPFDSRRGRNSEVAAQLREQLPHLRLEDLSPLLEEMRHIKSESELKLMRRAGELTGLGALAAMRATKPGVYEYELHAELEHVYVKGGARGDGYAPIIPGAANAGDPHYLDNQDVLEDGDIVLVDCAPDYQYYTSDIGRMWPVNGKFSPEQKALYEFVLRYHKAVLAQIRPGVMCDDVHGKAAEQMRPVFDKWEFVSKAQRETAAILFDFKGHISHGVGMAVHEISLHRNRPFEPGMVFAVDPMAWDYKNDTFYRVEDTVVVTADGYENLTASCPIEVAEIEAVMGGAAKSQAAWQLT